VPLLDVAVLVGVSGLDLLRHQPIVGQQGLVAPRELLLVRQVVHRRAQPVSAMPLRDSPQLPEGVLHPLAETLKTLRKADRGRLPIRVGEHEVVDQVLERLSLDGDPQIAHVGEITGTQPARFVDLGEEDLLGRPGLRPPTLDVPLQRPQLAVGEAARVAALQVLEERLGLQPRVDFQQGADLRPDLGKGVGARHPSMGLGQVAGQAAELEVLAGGLLVHGSPQRTTG
jgi:hypothetical protein